MLKRLFSTSTLKFSLKKLPDNPILPKNLGNNSPSTISQHFVDARTTFVIGGNGGDGLVSFMHLKGNEFAGPDGGDGGNGGHVIFQVHPGLKSLNQIRAKYAAGNGEQGRAYHMSGKSGKHVVIKVPPKTILRDESGEIVVEMNEHKTAKFVGARGGAGGKGNYYYLSNDNKKPKQFELGHKGQQKVYHMELRLIADAALIGLPNVGKSSILNALTRARAKVGDYAFTTVHPHVGVVEYEDFIQISIADFPGLLEDLTRGFGTRFLAHLEKCTILVIVLDVSSRCPTHPYDQYLAVKNAIDTYNSDFLKLKKTIIVAHKVDELENTDSRLDELRGRLGDNSHPIIPMSAKGRINLSKFLRLLRHVFEKKS